jgi:hypothetical protein
MGWGPLCAFLGVKQPDCPFPHVNDTAQFRRWTARTRAVVKMRLAGWLDAAQAAAQPAARRRADAGPTRAQVLTFGVPLAAAALVAGVGAAAARGLRRRRRRSGGGGV